MLLPSLRDLNKINTFILVAQRRSFTRAAAELRVTQSLVSRHITELEESLGFALLARSTHGVALTEYGQKFFDSCLRAFHDVDNAINSSRIDSRDLRGTLRVQVAPGIVETSMGRLIAPFTSLYPHVLLEVSTPTTGANPFEDGYDVVLSDKRPSGLGIDAYKVATASYITCAAPSYLQQIGPLRFPHDLKGNNCLVVGPFAPKEWIFEEAGKRISIEVKGGFCANSLPILVQAAIDGVGIIRLPLEVVAEHLDKGLLHQVLKEYQMPDEEITLYHATAKFVPLKIECFANFVRQEFPKLLLSKNMSTSRIEEN